MTTAAFQSTLPTRGSDKYGIPLGNLVDTISIHAPHEGERRACGKALAREPRISIHAPHEGERRYASSSAANPQNFNPRSPRGGATSAYISRRPIGVYFNPRSPRGGATAPSASWRARRCISIHAPHEGERRGSKRMAYRFAQFQSTLPTRGSDCNADFAVSDKCCDFNPRSPRGGATTTASRG